MVKNGSPNVFVRNLLMPSPNDTSSKFFPSGQSTHLQGPVWWPGEEREGELGGLDKEMDKGQQVFIPAELIPAHWNNLQLLKGRGLLIHSSLSFPPRHSAKNEYKYKSIKNGQNH